MKSLRFMAFATTGLILLAQTPGCATSSLFGSGQGEPDAAPNRQPQLNATTYFAHGHLLEREGNFAGAAEQYEKALAATPDFLTARNRLGIVLNKLGKHAEASREFQRAVAIQPGKAHLHNNLGFSLYLEGRYAEADAACRKAAELSPGFARAHMNRGLILGKLGRFDEARSQFLLAGNAASADYNLAMVYADAGRYDLATQTMQRAADLNPKLAGATEHLGRFRQMAAATPAPPPAPLPAAPAQLASSAQTTARPAAPQIETLEVQPVTNDPEPDAAGTEPGPLATPAAPATPAQQKPAAVVPAAKSTPATTHPKPKTESILEIPASDIISRPARPAQASNEQPASDEVAGRCWPVNIDFNTLFSAQSLTRVGAGCRAWIGVALENLLAGRIANSTVAVALL